MIYKKYLFFLIFNSISFITLSQDKSTSTLSKKASIYVDIGKTKTIFFEGVGYKDAPESLAKEHTINIKKKNISIFFKWKNPLKYQLKLSDSIINDSRIEDLKTAIKSISSVISKGASGFTPKSAILNNDCNILTYQTLKEDFPIIYNFGNNRISRSTEVCNTFKILLKLNSQGIPNIEKGLKLVTKELYDSEDVSKILLIISKAEAAIQSVKDEYKKNISLLYNLKESVEKLTDAQDAALKLKLDQLYNDQEKILEWGINYIPILVGYIDILKNSFEDQSNNFTEYYRRKIITLPIGKSIIFKIQEKKRILNTDMSLTEDSNEKVYNITIKRYDFITPTISSGLFYSSVSFKGYGVSTNSSDELIVTEDNLNENTALAGLFLNFNFDINSQFLSPLIQIGIDPTKKRPYLLLGGGFSVPSTSFSITGGAVWTWTPQLDKISIGDTVSSTSVLEENITYNFQTKPKGFYLGLNYEF